MTGCIGRYCSKPCCKSENFIGIYLESPSLIKFQEYFKYDITERKNGYTYLTKGKLRYVELLLSGDLTFEVGQLMLDLGACHLYNNGCNINNAIIENEEMINALSKWGIGPEVKPLQCRTYPSYNLFLGYKPRLQPLGKCLTIKEYNTPTSLNEKIKKEFENSKKLWIHIRKNYAPKEFIQALKEPITILK